MFVCLLLFCFFHVAVDCQHQIPNVIHFVKADDRPFSYMQYLAVKLAAERLNPVRIDIHTTIDTPPQNKWLDMIKRHAQFRPISASTNARIGRYANKGINFAAHFSDVIRLDVLIEEGGIYLDFDVITLRDMKDLQMGGGVVLGWEKVVPEYNPVIGVAVILAAPKQQFLSRWRDAMENTFNPNCYTCHSTQLVTQLSRQYPQEVRIVDWEYFYFPGWEPQAAAFLFSKAEERYEDTWQLFNVAKAIHLFGSLLNPGEKNGQYSEELTSKAVRANVTRFSRLCGPRPLEQ